MVPAQTVFAANTLYSTSETQYYTPSPCSPVNSIALTKGSRSQAAFPLKATVMCGTLTIPAVALDVGRMVCELMKKLKFLLSAVSIVTGLNMSVNGF